MADNIYTYIEDNFNIKITDYVFKRDYIKYPLFIPKNGVNSEKPHGDDLSYLYNTCNLSRNNLQRLFNCSEPTLTRWLRYYKIRRLNHLLKYNKSIAYYNISINDRKRARLEATTKRIKTISKILEVNPNYYVKIHKKGCKTKLVRYNDANYNNPNKIYKSRKKNHTLNTSSTEQQIFSLLKSKYNDTISQYKDKRYPFVCDFYIPSKDLFIEYQGHWTHGFESFVGSSEQLEKVKLWESRSKEINFNGHKKRSYIHALNVWTQRDPLKRKTAKDNNLNWLEFFNMDEFMKWYNQQ